MLILIRVPKNLIKSRCYFKTPYVDINRNQDDTTTNQYEFQNTIC